MKIKVSSITVHVLWFCISKNASIIIYTIFFENMYSFCQIKFLNNNNNKATTTITNTVSVVLTSFAVTLLTQGDTMRFF